MEDTLNLSQYQNASLYFVIMSDRFGMGRGRSTILRVIREREKGTRTLCLTAYYLPRCCSSSLKHVENLFSVLKQSETVCKKRLHFLERFLIR